MAKSKDLFSRRRVRNRAKLKRAGSERIRLSVFRSSKHIYAQLIDDREGRTLASASTLEKDMRSSMKSGADIEAAKAVGQKIAERATQVGIEEVYFDRGGYIYHGRVRALAESAREGGLKF